MTKDTVRQISVIIATVATIIMNILANALPLNGQNTGEISDRFPVLFVPAGYVFSIWGLIYIGMIAFTIFQALPAQKNNLRMRSVGWLYVLSSAANIAWLFFWHYNIFALTTVAMLILLGVLIAIYLRMGTGKTNVAATERWMARVPLSIYLGWITVATIANATDVLYLTGWTGAPLTPEIWTVILLAAALLITTIMLFTRRDVAYALVIAWAAYGISVKQAGVNLVLNAAVATAALVVLLVVLTLLKLTPKRFNIAAV